MSSYFNSGVKAEYTMRSGLRTPGSFEPLNIARIYRGNAYSSTMTKPTNCEMYGPKTLTNTFSKLSVRAFRQSIFVPGQARLLRYRFYHGGIIQTAKGSRGKRLQGP